MRVPIRPGRTSKALKPGGEIELLVEERVVGNVHLPVEAGHPAVRVEDDRAVVEDAGGAPLEDRDDHGHAPLLRRPAQGLGARPRHRLGEGEVRVVLLLAEVGRAVHLGQAHDLGPEAGRLADLLPRLADVVLG
jgi:hypothetical protein